MDNDNAMQVDTGLSECGVMTSKHQDVEKAMLDILRVLRESLSSFIISELKQALGEDVYSEFVPKAKSTEVELLQFIQKKWVGVFCDSAMEHQERLVEQLLKLIKSVMKQASNARGEARLVLGSETRLNEIGASVESLLMAIAPTQAAQVAHLMESAGRRKCRDVRWQHGEQNVSTFRTGSSSGRAADPCAMTVDQEGSEKDTDVGTEEIIMVERWKFSGMWVVLDGSNIGWRHGNCRHFSLRGAMLAFQYFEIRGHFVVMFLPEARVVQAELDNGAVGVDYGSGGNDDSEGGSKWRKKIEQLQRASQLVSTPAGDYDDVYLCDFARRHGAVVVSNDGFRDIVYQAGADSLEKGRNWSEWLLACRLTFTFHGDEFLPNPAFHWDKAAKVAARLRPMEPGCG